MTKINNGNYIPLIIENLEILKDAFADGVIPSMIFDGDEEDKITELQNLVDFIQKTNRRKNKTQKTYKQTL